MSAPTQPVVLGKGAVVRIKTQASGLRPQACLVALLAGFAALSLYRLDAVPLVFEDEPWQGSTGYKLATQGVFGSDMFAGFYGMEDHYFGFLPLHPLFLALFFRLFGVGLVSARLEAVVMGLLTLALTYALGRRLFGGAVGLLAVALLVFVSWASLSPLQPTGIPLLDLSRIARYDTVVPVFGLGALHIYLFARQRGANWLYLLAGALAGLAGLAHLYGTFWLPALLALLLWDQGGQVWRRPRVPSGCYLLLAGALLAWLPYLAFVLAHYADFRGQNQIYVLERRFDLLNPSWYWQNLRGEARRYTPGLGPLGGSWLLHPGWWTAILGLPLSLGDLAVRAARRDPEGAPAAARAVVAPLLVLVGLFALLLSYKVVNYTLTLLPLAAIVLAWGLVALWRGLARARRGWLGQATLAVLLLAVATEGGWRIADAAARTAQNTPYDQYIGRVRQAIPPGARILGLQNYWFGLEAYDYRAYVLPQRWTDPALVPDPVPFDVALDRVAPDVILIDPRLRNYLDAAAPPDHPRHEEATRFWAWMERRGARLVARVEDRTYGAMDIYEGLGPPGGYPA